MIMNYLISFFFITVLFFNTHVFSLQNQKIIFKINDTGYSNLDFERRINYIEIINKIEINKEDKESINEILDDYISSLVFYEYKKKYFENNYQVSKEVSTFYNSKVLNNEIYKNLNNEEILTIKNNIKIDLIRKKIIEGFLNNKKDQLRKEMGELDLIYKYDISFITFKTNDIDLNSFKIQNRKDFDDLKKHLIVNDISFLEKKEEINDMSVISNNLKILLKNNDKINITIDKKYTNIISIDKNLESYEGIFVKLISYNSLEKIDAKQLNCNFAQSLENKTLYKEYEYVQLNEQIKENLKSINDYIVLENNGVFNYIFLCELRYDEKILNTLNFNKQVNIFAKKIETKFLTKYKKEFNLIIN